MSRDAKDYAHYQGVPNRAWAGYVTVSETPKAAEKTSEVTQDLIEIAAGSCGRLRITRFWHATSEVRRSHLREHHQGIWSSPIRGPSAAVRAGDGLSANGRIAGRVASNRTISNP